VHKTVFIIYPLILQTITIAQTMSTGGEGDNDLISPQKSTINTGVTPNINSAIDSFPLTRLFPTLPGFLVNSLTAVKFPDTSGFSRHRVFQESGHPATKPTYNI